MRRDTAWAAVSEAALAGAAGAGDMEEARDGVGGAMPLPEGGMRLPMLPRMAILTL